VVVNGQQRDIGFSIDAQGAQFAARTASVAISIADLLAGFGRLPNAVVDESAKKWLASFTAPTGGLCRFAVATCMPDTLGCAVLMLEDFET
jgi:hypothetical protein